MRETVRGLSEDMVRGGGGLREPPSGTGRAAVAIEYRIDSRRKRARAV
jgi:hypothetical protein